MKYLFIGVHYKILKNIFKKKLLILEVVLFKKEVKCFFGEDDLTANKTYNF
jgi:hypothetical protein